MENSGWSTLLSGKAGVRTLTLVGAVALHAINIYIVVTILPSIVREIGGERYYSWAATIFMATSLLGATLAPKLPQLMSPRFSYIFAAVTFALGTFICGFAYTMPLFLFGRMVQGLGGGFLLSLAYSMVRIVFPPNLWPRALSVISGMWGVSTLLGPAIGGLFAQFNIWRASFILVGILSILFVIAAYRVLPKKNGNQVTNHPIPLIQITLLILVVCVISLATALNTTPEKIAAMALGTVLFFVLAVTDSFAKKKLLPTGSFSYRSPFFYIYSLMLILAISVNGAELYLPLFLQELHGEEPLVAGYLTALMSLGWTIGSLTSASAQTKRVILTVKLAPLIAIFGFAILFFYIPSANHITMFIPKIALALLLIGIGIGSTWPHILTSVLLFASDSEADRASASLTTVQLYSTAVSSALAGIITVFSGITDNPSNVTSSAHVLLGAIILLLVGGIPFAFTVAKKMAIKNRGM